VSDPSGGPSPSSAAESPSLGAAGAELVRSVKRRLRRVLELAAAEGGLAAMSGISLLIMAIVAAALLIVAWVLLVSVLAYALVLLGVPWIAAGLGLALAHLAVAYYLYRKALKMTRDLTLPGLRSVLLSED
jgi:hypothetical protein